MLKVKCAYYVKIFVITVLSVVLLTLVEIAPDFPFAFVMTAMILIIVIRLLWISLLKDERKTKAAKYALRPKLRNRGKLRNAA